MKKPILFLSLMLLAIQCFSQATKRITKDSLKFREKYDVLKSDPAIKQGYYQLLEKSSAKTLVTGYYKNNRKDGTWHEFDNSSRVIVEGRYSNGKKIGEWKYFDDFWQLANVFDFTKNQLTYHLPTHSDSIMNYRVLRNPADTLTAIMDRPPVYLGGDVLLTRSIINNLVSPPAAVKAHIAGKTAVSFTLDANGQTRDYHITGMLRPDCDQAALEAVKKIPDNWVPGRYNGRPVAVVILLQVGFDFRKK